VADAPAPPYLKSITRFRVPCERTRRTRWIIVSNDRVQPFLLESLENIVRESSNRAKEQERERETGNVISLNSWMNQIPLVRYFGVETQSLRGQRYSRKWVNAVLYQHVGNQRPLRRPRIPSGYPFPSRINKSPVVKSGPIDRY